MEHIKRNGIDRETMIKKRRKDRGVTFDTVGTEEPLIARGGPVLHYEMA